MFWYVTECNSGLIDGYDAALTSDIELAGHEFTAINNLPKDSDFDGQGHAIRNLYATYTTVAGGGSATNVGALVNVCNGTIENLTITGLYEVYTQNSGLPGAVTLGTFAGVSNATIQNCTSEVEISVKGLVNARSKVQVGGIAGQAVNLTGCINYGNITVDVVHDLVQGNYIGGIVGIYTGAVESCANYGDITAKQYFTNYIGGIAGYTAKQTASVTDCYNVGKVMAEKAKFAGGIVGLSNYGSQITNCFNYGSVQAEPYKEGQTLYISAISNNKDWAVGTVTSTVYTNNYYLSGSVPEGYTGSAAVQIKKEITEDVGGQIEMMIASQFADGTVLAALNGEEGTVFGQRVGTDSYPIFQSFIDGDAAAASAVEALIDAIGAVTLESEDAIVSAEKAYNALTGNQKAMVSNYDVLTLAREAYDKLASDHAAADAVKALIDAIGTVNRHSKEKIDAARKAYEDLTEEQKALVTNYDCAGQRGRSL